MNIKVLLTAKTTEPYINEGIRQYVKRLNHYARIEWKELTLRKKNSNPLKVAEDEAEMNLQLIPKAAFVVLLDEKGKEFSSEGFAQWLEKRLINQSNDLVFVTGGAYGFHQLMYDRADLLLSLSKFTFTHQMARLIFAEQLYRAFTIIRNEKYHH